MVRDCAFVRAIRIKSASRRQAAVAKRPLLTRITRPKSVLQSGKSRFLQTMCYTEYCNDRLFGSPTPSCRWANPFDTSSYFDHCNAAGSAGGSSMAPWPPPLGGAKRA
jgi:hypothetical protein